MRTNLIARAALCVGVWSVIVAAPVRADVPGFEKQLVFTITQEQLKSGIVSQVAWDNGVLIVQGVFVKADGQLSDQYFVAPAEGMEVRHLSSSTRAAMDYWQRKSRRVSPTGVGTIMFVNDASIPMNSASNTGAKFGDKNRMEGIMNTASDMGGMTQTNTLRLGSTELIRRNGSTPYEGETYSWSPLVINRIAYTDSKGNLHIAGADGGNSQRVLKGNFTLPAWSDDGRWIAVTERRDGGKKWDISVISVPENYR